MSIVTEVSLGEFLDKVTILRIKHNRIKDQTKLVNIDRELDKLTSLWAESPFADSYIGKEMAELYKINEKLWEIEDSIREKEFRKEFDEEFIELARSVYITNDKRASLKKELNEKLGSGLIEEKSYKSY